MSTFCKIQNVVKDETSSNILMKDTKHMFDVSVPFSIFVIFPILWYWPIGMSKPKNVLPNKSILLFDR